MVSVARVSIGIIMLNTNFPRPLGDVGNIDSYRYPAIIYKLTSANVSNVVCAQLSEDIVREVLEAGANLQRQGVTVLTTSCGFLAPLQQRIQQRLQLPFLASSLSLLPFLRQVFGSKSKIAVITFDSSVLQPLHFNGHWDEHLLIAGIEHGGELHRVIKCGTAQLNTERALQDVIDAVQSLMIHQPQCLLLECTNLSPYKPALRAHFKLPVFDLVDAVHWLADAH